MSEFELNSRHGRVPKYAHLPHFVDRCDCDLESLNCYYTIKKGKQFYRARGIRRPWKHQVYLHREIAERIIGRPLVGLERADHMDGNGLNNRRDNLRVVTHAMNLQNLQQPCATNTSGHRGVYLDKRCGKWVACGRTNGKNVRIGSFEKIEAAAEAAHHWRLVNVPGYIPVGGSL
jgi:hypothetical protein